VDGGCVLSLLLSRPLLGAGGAALGAALEAASDQARLSVCAALGGAAFASAAGQEETGAVLARLLRARAESLGGASAPLPLVEALAAAAAAAPRAAAAAVAAPLLLAAAGGAGEAARGALLTRALAAQRSPAFGRALLPLLCAEGARWGEAALCVLAAALLGEARLLPQPLELPGLAEACEAAAAGGALAGSARFGKLLHGLARGAEAGGAAAAALRRAAAGTRTLLTAATLRLLDAKAGA